MGQGGRCTDRWFTEEAVHVSSASFVLTSQKRKTNQDRVENSPLMTPLLAQWMDCIPATYAFPDFHEIGQLTLGLNLLRNEDSEPLKERGTHSLPSRSFTIVLSQ